MTDLQHRETRTHIDDDDPLLALASTFLRWRGTISRLAALGAIVGLLAGLLRPRTYVSEAIFLPQASEANLSGLAQAASAFGVRLPVATEGEWGPPVYVELLQSRTLLEPIARDTIIVAEEGGRHMAVLDLLKVNAKTPAERIDRGVEALRLVVSTEEAKTLGAVRLDVSTRWPSVSFILAQKLVDAVQRATLETRQSQAGAERRFAESRAQEAEQALRQAEDRLQLFLQRNRVITGSAELAFQQDRLQREVGLRQQLYTALLQGEQEARIREVRDTPVITVLEAPQLPVLPSHRRAILKAIAGGLAGGFLGLALAFFARGLARARLMANSEMREFLKLLDEATPKIFRRRDS